MEELIGKRVKLLFTDQHSDVKSGDTGTIWHIVPSNGVLRVKWDDGGRLDLYPDEDKWEIIG